MPTAILDTDHNKALRLLQQTGMPGLQHAIAAAIADERERCAQIAEAINSGRGNEKEIAKAIRAG